jgi:hypothetical protein
LYVLKPYYEATLMTRTVSELLRAGAITLLALLPAAAHAGVRFDFTAEASTYKYSGTMTLEGKRLRVDVVEGNHPLFNPNVTMISRDGGAQIVVLDHAAKTYFQRAGAPMAGPLATVRGIGPSEALKPRVARRRDGGEGDLARHIVTAEYGIVMDVGGEKVNGSVEIEAEFEVDPSVRQFAHPWGLQFATKTGFDRVDEALAKRVPQYLPVRQVVTASRQIEGGPVVTERLVITVSNVVRTPVSDGVFMATPGYRYVEPVFSFGD